MMDEFIALTKYLSGNHVSLKASAIEGIQECDEFRQVILHQTIFDVKETMEEICAGIREATFKTLLGDKVIYYRLVLPRQGAEM